MQNPYSNYKTQLCKYWKLEGKCTYRSKCMYAHGEHELRSQFDPLPPDFQLFQASQSGLAEQSPQKGGLFTNGKN